MSQAAVGLKAHTGWAVAVTLYGSPSSPAVGDRRRLDLTDPVLPRAVYHTARTLELEDAEQLVRRRLEAAEASAGRAIGELVADLGARGHELVAGAIVRGRGRPAATVAGALSSHVAMHAAEGELYRDALLGASEECGLRVTSVQEHELDGRLAAVLHHDPGHVREYMDGLGRSLGPPWARDQKSAALAAWFALASASGSS